MKQKITFALIVFLLQNNITKGQEFIFEHFNSGNTAAMSSGNNFKSVRVTSTGQIWAGSQYQGFFRYNPASSLWEKSPDITNVSVNDIRLGQSDDIWVGQSGTVGSGSIAGGVNRFANDGSVASSNFYSITGSGGLTSRNVRSIWIDKNHRGPDNKYRVWAAQGTYVSSGNTLAGGISVGLNPSGNSFTKIYLGLQVTPNVPAAQAGTPNCISIGGNDTEVWICALQNFGRTQLLRYRADEPGTFLGYYDYTNSPVFSAGFRANAIFFDRQGRGWLGMNDGSLIIKNGEGWTTMNNTAVLPAGTAINANAIDQDERGNIYFGTSNGLLIYNGGDISSAASYRMLTTADGLPVNNIAGVAADTVNKRIVLAHASGISFLKFNKKIDYSMEWDYSFPKETIKPLGVAADGTSRLYLKIRRGTNVSMPIKKIAVSIKNIATQTANVCGKVKKAIETSQYSNEANTGTSTDAERTDSTSTGDFYFWYVAPDDFSADSLSNFAQLGERNDTVKIKVIYGDNSEDSTYMPVKVVRPPLVLTSMAANAKKVIESVKIASDQVPLIFSSKFFSKVGIAMNQSASLVENASRLIDGDEAQNDDVKNSYQGILTDARKKGIVATRVDMIANDVAGIAVRVAQSIKPAKFFADGNQAYNNYGRGYINKFISVNVPHQGSAFFQLIKDFGGGVNQMAKKVVQTLENAEKDPEPYGLIVEENGEMQIASAIIGKALTDAGNYKLPETVVKNHLISTELTTTGAVAEGLANINKTTRKLLDFVVLAARDISPALKPQIGAQLGAEISSNDRLLSFINNYSAMKGTPNFVTLGDVISNSTSQLAGVSPTANNVTKQVYSVAQNLAGHLKTINGCSQKIVNLLNTGINSNSFGSSIPANNVATTVANVATKVGRFLYDTARIVITNREEMSNAGLRITQNGNSSTNLLNDTTILLHYTIKDTAQLQYVFVNFLDSIYTSTSRERNQSMPLRIKKSMLFSGNQEISAVAVYENADSIKYHADTLNSWLNKPDTLRGFRIVEETADLFDGMNYTPAYEVKINEEWETLAANDPDISFTIENTGKAAYYSTGNYFKAIDDGFTRVYFQYKTYRDTVALNCMLPLSAIAINRSIVTGSFKAASTWSKGRAPLPSDSVIISTGHNIVLDTTVQIRSLKIETGATLTLNNSALQLQLGDAEDGAFMIDNYGTLSISNGTLKVSGRVKHNAGASFNMSGGSLIIDGNTGYSINSLENGLYLFEAATGMASFNFTGGTLQLVDPPIGVASQALYCPYNFGAGSTLALGNGISVTASNNANGFGGSGFPPQIGKLILDATVQGNNRQLKITKPLSVKSNFQIKTGSNLNIQAPVTVIP